MGGWNKNYEIICKYDVYSVKSLKYYIFDYYQRINILCSDRFTSLLTSAFWTILINCIIGNSANH